MNEKPTILDSEDKKPWTPPAPAPKKFRWQPSAEFVLLIALIGDALVVFSSLSLGYWVRFQSGWIPFFGEVRSGFVAQYFDYLNLLVEGTIFLLATFGYLRLYSQHSFKRYLRTARVIVQGTFFWLFAYYGREFDSEV